MLDELKNITQDTRKPGYRRWFADEELDLIVWYRDSGEISGFQLCYDITGWERAFTWRRNEGLIHTAVDSGEDWPLHNRSPLLVSDPASSAEVEVERVLAEFKARSEALEPRIAEIVMEAISGFEPKPQVR